MSARSARKACISARPRSPATRTHNTICWKPHRKRPTIWPGAPTACTSWTAAPALLNPLWYAGSYALGALAGLRGDDWSLGFVVETERQVEAHLDEHLETLPDIDQRSRAILRVMKIDEARHADQAEQAGARQLPAPIPGAMALASKLMKTVAYRL